MEKKKMKEIYIGETDVCEIRGDDGQGSRLHCRR